MTFSLVQCWAVIVNKRTCSLEEGREEKNSEEPTPLQDEHVHGPAFKMEPACGEPGSYRYDKSPPTTVVPPPDLPHRVPGAKGDKVSSGLWCVLLECFTSRHKQTSTQPR